MKDHQDMILAIKDKIKPGFISVLFRSYSREMLTNYLRSLKDEIRQAEQEAKWKKEKKLGIDSSQNVLLNKSQSFRITQVAPNALDVSLDKIQV